MADKYCLNCGSRIPDGLKYCPVCGNPVQNEIKQIKNPINPKNLSSDRIHLEDEPLPVQPENMERTQKINADTIRIDDQKLSAEDAKPKHGKLYSTFIEDDDEYDDYEDENEGGGHHIGRIILIIVLAFAAGALLFLLTQKLDLFSSHSGEESTPVPSAVTTSTPEPTEEATSTPETVPEENQETQENANGVIGSVEALQDINIRTEPSTDAGSPGTVSAGETYDVYETTSDGTLTWYRIGDDEWIADGGGWVSYTAN